MRYILAAIFTFLLISPILAFIPTIGDQGWVLALIWIVFALIMVYYVEFWHRAELWHVCICRGLILDYKDTHELKQWVLHPVMLTAFAFILTCGVIVGISKEGEVWEKIVTGVLTAIGLAFVFSVCKSIIGLEEGNRILTLNMLITYLDDPHLLEAQGFKVIHQTQLIRWYTQRPKVKGESGFSWNQLYELDYQKVEEPKRSSFKRYFWGTLISNHIKRYKDLDA